MHILHSYLPTKTTQMKTSYESPSQHTKLSIIPTTSPIHPTISGAAEAFVSINVPSVHPFQPVSIPAISVAPIKTSSSSGVTWYTVLPGVIVSVMVSACVAGARAKNRERRKSTRAPNGGRQQARTNVNEAPQVQEPEPIRLAPRHREYPAVDEIEEQGERNQIKGYDASPIAGLEGITPGSDLRVPVNPNENRVLLLNPRTNGRPASVMSGRTLVAAIPRAAANARLDHIVAHGEPALPNDDPPDYEPQVPAERSKVPSDSRPSISGNVDGIVSSDAPTTTQTKVG